MLESLQNEKKLLPERVAEQIITLIKDKELKEGDKLPNEFEMAKQLHVGRGTIREAVKILVSRHVLEIKRGCGTFVCQNPGKIDDPLGFAFVSDKKKLAYDLYELRMMIEPNMAALAAEKADEEGVAELQKIADEIKESIAKGQDYLEKDIQFHALISQLSQNSVVSTIIPVLQTGISFFIHMTNKSLMRETIETHQLLVNAIADHDSQAAKKAMEQHLKYNKEKMDEMMKEG
ncbi:FadR/GntR family transcriptional regulator [uncultured Traorella sp.]|uniref:FadR/GntR family transcriptional regulator n=1 Tax=uncultured Traorella sp. TaxID=1929048 RepID=UPI0025E4A76B|nr:FadR/GntR family transcriptional regulator [uncultured Traorella sp.]